MSDPKVLKGVFREGALIASVIQQDESARIMLKGAEAGEPGFLDALRKTAAACKEHVAGFARRELCAVLVQSGGKAETVAIPPEELQAMGLTRIALMDGDCGAVVRAFDTDPAPTPLAYASLRAGGSMALQPGTAIVPDSMARKAYRDLEPSQKKVFEVAAQLSARSLLKLFCFEDEGLRLVAVLWDLPPARGKSILVPIGDLAKELDGGTPVEEIARRLAPLRG
jgi:hypothetical protein